jgi:hypothetical protein
MKRGPHDTFSNASLDRRASITLHETIKPKAKKKPISKPGSYAEPKPPGAALPRTMAFGGELEPTPHQYVRAGASDFLLLPSKGFSC